MANQTRKVSNEESGASERKLWFRSDLVVIAVLLCVAAIFYLVRAAGFDGAGGYHCEISLDGEVVMTAPLGRDRIFALEQKPNVIFEIKDGAVAFISSDCPDKVCIHSGFLHQAGQSAACLPNRIMVTVKSENGDDSPDIVV